MNTMPISFALLDGKVREYIGDMNGDDRPGRLERWSMVIGWTAGGVGFVLSKVLSGKLALMLASTALVLELGGLGVGLACGLRREWRSFRQSHAQLALELDRTYARYCEITASLRQHPRAALQRHLRYLQARKATLVRRMGLFFGNMERLGVLPVLVVLYVQFRDWRFADWASIWANVHWVGGLLLWALLLVYLGSWLMVRLQNRLDLYETLLAEALEEGC